jgi:hypothetical protein
MECLESPTIMNLFEPHKAADLEPVIVEIHETASASSQDVTPDPSVCFVSCETPTCDPRAFTDHTAQGCLS